MAKAQVTTKGVSVAQMLEKAKTEMGDDIGSIGGEWEDLERIPTGVFEFDVATGGGYPQNRVTLIYGNESSTKTVHAMLGVAGHQRKYPDKICGYIGIEGYSGSDKDWFRSLGVDVDKLAVMVPTTAEQVVDLVDSFCWSTDAGLLVVDSLAAMMTATEFEDSAEKKHYGGSSVPISVMGRKLHAALNKAPSNPTVILINQPRTKVGIAYGDPTTLPGGNMVNNFLPNMKIKLYGKNEMDTKYSKAMPVRKKVTMSLVKWKVPIINQVAEYEIAMLPHKGLRPGQTDWFNQFNTYAQALGMLKKGPKDKGWECFDQTWSTLKELKDALYGDSAVMEAVVADMVSALAANGQVLEPKGD